MADVFKRGINIDVSAKVREKNGLSYLSWASAWAEFKKLYPDGKITLIPSNIIKSEEPLVVEERPWHDDGKTGWVSVMVEAEGESLTEWLPILDFKNKAIPVENITALEANKAYKRCTVKAIAMLTGIGLYIYEGEDMPEEVSKVKNLQAELMKLINLKCKNKDLVDPVAALCRETLPDECNGNPTLCDDPELLGKLKKSLLAMRVAKKTEE